MIQIPVFSPNVIKANAACALQSCGVAATQIACLFDSLDALGSSWSASGCWGMSGCPLSGHTTQMSSIDGEAAKLNVPRYHAAEEAGNGEVDAGKSCNLPSVCKKRKVSAWACGEHARLCIREFRFGKCKFGNNCYFAHNCGANRIQAEVAGSVDNSANQDDEVAEGAEKSMDISLPNVHDEAVVADTFEVAEVAGQNWDAGCMDGGAASCAKFNIFDRGIDIGVQTSVVALDAIVHTEVFNGGTSSAQALGMQSAFRPQSSQGMASIDRHSNTFDEDDAPDPGEEKHVAKQKESVPAIVPEPEIKANCLKCDGSHDSDECPYFTLARGTHGDCWKNVKTETKLNKSGDAVYG